MQPPHTLGIVTYGILFGVEGSEAGQGWGGTPHSTDSPVVRNVLCFTNENRTDGQCQPHSPLGRMSLHVQTSCTMHNVWCENVFSEPSYTDRQTGGTLCVLVGLPCYTVFLLRLIPISRPFIYFFQEKQLRKFRDNLKEEGKRAKKEVMSVRFLTETMILVKVE